MVRSRDQDDVEVLLLEHLAIVGIGARSFLRGLSAGDDFRSLGQHLLVDVAERDDLDGRDLNEAEEVGLAVPAAADQADPLCLVAGESGCVFAADRKRQACGRRGVEKVATVHGFVLCQSGFFELTSGWSLTYEMRFALVRTLPRGNGLHAAPRRAKGQ